MIKAKKYFLLCCFEILFISFTIAQNQSTSSDSVEDKLKLDLGWTRIKNINVWPIFKRTATAEKTDLQIIAPIFRKSSHVLNNKKHNHLLPFYLYDKSDKERHLRIGSLLYPSLIHNAYDSVLKVRNFNFIEFAPEISLFHYKRSEDGSILENSLFFNFCKQKMFDTKQCRNT